MTTSQAWIEKARAALDEGGRQMMRALAIVITAALLAAGPTLADEAVFQQNLNGYTGAEDAWLRNTYPIRNYGNHWAIRTQDRTDPGQGWINQGLLIFRDIFGNAPGQVPLGGEIHSATLTLGTAWGDEGCAAYLAYPLLTEITNYGTGSTGDAVDGEVNHIGREYWAADNYTPWGTDNPSTDGPVEGEDFDMNAEVRSLGPDGQPGGEVCGDDEPVSADVTAIVRSWYSGALPNYGLVLRALDGMYTNWWSSEPYVGKEHLSPMLTLDYTATGTCNPGDADADGDVDDDDLSLLLANWASETATCAEGEFSNVPPVNDDDLSLLLANWTGSQDAAVPEPATIVILAAGVLVLSRRRK